MSMNEGMYSSKDTVRETPPDFFERLDREFHFDRDVCAIAANTKCETFFSPEDDALQQDWIGTCWMNPPYGREIGKWLQKDYEEAQKGAVVVCLLPSRTDTRWWHDWVMRAKEVRLVKGRLTFVGCASAAPFPSAVVVFTKRSRLPGISPDLSAMEAK